MVYARSLAKLHRSGSVRFDEEGRIEDDLPPVGGYDEFGLTIPNDGLDFSQPAKF